MPSGEELFDGLKRACGHSKALMQSDKIEPRPRHPTHFATWLKQARNEIKMIGSVLGLEHMAGRKEALEQIEKAHEADPEAWPEAYCFSLWQELKVHYMGYLPAFMETS